MEGVAPNFGIGRGRAGVAVFVKLKQQIVARVLAVNPEADTHIATPILGCPCVNGLVLESVGGSTPAIHVQVNLEEVVIPCLAGHGQRVVIGHQGGGNGDCRACPCVAPCDKADAVAVAV